jgi:hypothetical protein
LKPATILSHLSPREKQIRYETEEKAKISGFPSAKELRQVKESAAARLKREEEDAEKIGMVCCNSVVRNGLTLITLVRNAKYETVEGVGLPR